MQTTEDQQELFSSLLISFVCYVSIVSWIKKTCSIIAIYKAHYWFPSLNQKLECCNNFFRFHYFLPLLLNLERLSFFLNSSSSFLFISIDLDFSRFFQHYWMAQIIVVEQELLRFRQQQTLQNYWTISIGRKQERGPKAILRKTNNKLLNNKTTGGSKTTITFALNPFVCTYLKHTRTRYGRKWHFSLV